MATVIQSNNVYVGTKSLPNIIDSITSTSAKTEYLKKLLASANLDSTYITDVNSDAIFNTLKLHRTRVISDGGIVLSLAITLKAIVFAFKNSLTSSIYSAYSPEFGLKMNGSSVIKIYDLSGRDYELLSGSLERSIDGAMNVVKNLITSTMISKQNSIAGGTGMILGACVHDADIAASSSLTVRGMYMSENAAATGTGLGYLETNYGGQARLYYKRAADDVMTNLPYDQSVNYKKFAGLVGYLSNSNNRVEIYENGVIKAGATAPQKDISASSIYPAMSMLSLNSLYSESWIIKSTSQSLAIALSNHLNKSS